MSHVVRHSFESRLPRVPKKDSDVILEAIISDHHHHHQVQMTHGTIVKNCNMHLYALSLLEITCDLVKNRTMYICTRIVQLYKSDMSIFAKHNVNSHVIILFLSPKQERKTSDEKSSVLPR